MITPVRRNWSPKVLFNALTPAMFTAEPSVVRARWDKLWPDLYTEYDARHLKKELSIRSLIVTDEAEAFFDAWAADEERHTDGFVQIIELVAGGSEENLRERLNDRSHNFSSISEYLKDEFSLMVMIAFDEMCTCHAYATEREFYVRLRNDRFLRWLREVIADEAVHSMNAVNVIRARYDDRIREVGPILDSLISGFANDPPYAGTFVLDYFGGSYTKELFAKCRATILRNIAKPLTTAERNRPKRRPL
ncbi:hypothetical protein NLM33_38665 [Bradyrhizobium sp. CCGUVB1N3]|uniref:hypothetical protein n=1 Tax=Bradyrhizobium sp. CCGUVB1N3 TaxID=2949629 RepID=UPI0020B42B91|nr:hypothetical protein [Bradyrhizobium sp. CCGUVB1N3]MCP3476149.1 hypothetical protein [Bradyrhizobium sp. CCGUVB1N3]